ncbi:hypothetical protein BGZ49_008169 [Haplosporangium sp. Z 27]|nr:hypothetical protein BGZ49_008169 [Haplosporangium sp. Z 27]
MARRLLSTALCGSFKVSPWARSSSPETCPNLARATSRLTPSSIKSNSVQPEKHSCPKLNSQELIKQAGFTDIDDSSSGTRQTELLAITASNIVGNEENSQLIETGKDKQMSQSPTPCRLERLTEISPQLLPELPVPRKLPIRPVPSPVLDPISTSCQGKKSSQKGSESETVASHQNIASEDVILPLHVTSSNDSKPTISGKTWEVENHRQNDQWSQNTSQRTPNSIPKDHTSMPLASSSQNYPSTSINEAADMNDVEFIPCTPERVPGTQMDDDHGSGVLNRSPVFSSSLDRSLLSGKEPIPNSFDQHSSSTSSPTASVKRTGSSTSSQGKKKSGNRKKIRRSLSSSSVADSVPSSPLISSTALFEANIADIERYVDQDLYGYNNLSY